jgi:hypothetical protein
VIVTGAIFGGLLIGMGSQVFILPYCDLIAGNPICVFSLSSALRCGGIRVRLPGFELPEAIQQAQSEFGNRLAMGLDRMADRLKGDESAQEDDLTSAYAQLEQATWKALPEKQHQQTPKIKLFLLLSRRIATLEDYLQRKM